MRKDFLVHRLGDRELLAGMKRITSNERKVQCQFLVYLAEVEKRKLHAEQGYPSLFKYVCEELGHSASSALKRIQVARLARKVPAVYWALEEGRVSLSVLSRLSPYLNEGNQVALMKECERKSVREAERVIVKYFPKADVAEKVEQDVTPLSIDKFRVYFTADTAFTEKLEKAKQLLSHRFPEGKLADILGEALDALIENETPKTKVTEKIPDDHIPRGIRTLDSRYIPRGIRAEVWKRDEGQCTYVSAEGRRCSGKTFLEYDHVQPWAVGGSSHSAGNIRLLCSTHNKFLAWKTFGSGGSVSVY